MPCCPIKIFSFDDYPRAKKRVDAMLKTLQKDMRTVVEGGIEASWQLSNEKNDELVTSILGKRLVSQLTDEQRRRYFTNNADALEAFRKRKDNGLALSDRVWNYSNQFKTEIELALDVGLGQGKSADELSRDVRKFLKYPDKLFRRVRDKHGNLKLSKAAAAFHPGRGVYRSSYKNARRLTATECNMAYRAADYERWQTMDFVVGIRIVLSNNHEPDICDDLKGDYPKTFKFTGWHPHCRCHVETILKTTAEMQADTERIKAGNTPTTGSVNEVKELPSQFTTWAQANKDRILEAQGRGSLPYFLRDNWLAVDSIFNPKPKELTLLEKAELRHKARTQAQIDDIRRRAAERQARHEAMRKEAADALAEAKSYAEVDYRLLRKYIGEGNLDKMYAVAAAVRKRSADMRASEQALEQLIPDVHDWHRQFTLQELREVYNAVGGTLTKWASLSPETQKKKLSFEIKWVRDNKKYPTWEVAEKAYKRQLSEVQYKIDVGAVNNSLAQAESFSATHKRFTKLSSLLQQAKADIAAGKPMADIQKSADAALKEYTKKLAAVAKKNNTVVSASPFGADAYSAERKKNALNCRSEAESLRELEPEALRIYRSASKGEKKAWLDYTKGSGHINRPLRGYSGNWHNYYGLGKVPLDTECGEKNIRNLYALLDKNPTKRDIMLVRGSDFNAAEEIFGAPPTGANLKPLIGQTFTDYGFISCGAASGTGFTGMSVNYKIYCPAGTKGVYLWPHSYYRHLNHENEFVLQAGTKFRLTAVKEISGRLYVEMEVVGYEKHPLL